jgi:hypothetical protein
VAGIFTRHDYIGKLREFPFLAIVKLVFFHNINGLGGH